MFLCDGIALKCCEAVPMRRLGHVQSNTRTVLVKLAQAALCQGKMLLCGELHPIKSDGLILRHATAAQVAHGQQTLRAGNALTSVS